MKANSTYYHEDYKGIRMDPYRILDVWGITHPAQQHAIKKLLRAGRGGKELRQDIAEVVESLERWLDMLGEDAEAVDKVRPRCTSIHPQTRLRCVKPDGHSGAHMTKITEAGAQHPWPRRHEQ